MTLVFGAREKKSFISVKDVDQNKFVMTYAELLKQQGKIKVPTYVNVVKTGIHREMAPFRPDWFYIRCAAVARDLYFRRTGVKRFATKFGGKKRRGCAPSRFHKAGRNIIRKCLQGLEELNLVKKDERKGRVLTSMGRSELDKLASQIYNNQI